MEDLEALLAGIRAGKCQSSWGSVVEAPSRNESLRIVFGALGGDVVCCHDRTQVVPSQTQTLRLVKNFGFAPILREGEATNVTFRTLGAT